MNYHSGTMPQDAIAQSITAIDQALDKRRLATLSLSEAQTLLGQIEQFHSQLRQMEVDASDWTRNEAEQSAVFRSRQTLIAAGCRACADLSEQVLMRMVEMLQDKQHSLDFLNQELRKKIREQHQARTLVLKAQQLRSENNEISEQAGLGLIL